MDFRQDIQFLRGFAVSIVIIQHAGFGPAAGYLGVDIFFVISGFLITQMICAQIDRGNFAFSEFYYRRAKRLLPAAYVTLALTAVAAPFFLGSAEYADFVYQLIGSVTFTSNLVLESQSGYFDTSSDLKPLLHTWSLSLEEQFYLLFPMALVLTKRQHWPFMVAGLLLASAVVCWYLSFHNPSGAFYFLHARAWELMIGSLVAILKPQEYLSARLVQITFWPAVAVVLLLPFFPTGYPHPGLDSLLICLATAAILVRRHAELGIVKPTNTIAWLGNPSYSLYLAHWPIIAFVHNAYIGEIGAGERIAMIFVAFLVGLLLYYLVERPIHRSNHLPKLRVTGVVAMSAAIVLLMPTVITSKADTKAGDLLASDRARNYGLARSCNQQGVYRLLPEDCQTSNTPLILLWGDSFAMHLAAAIRSSTQDPIRQATQSSCPPAMGFAVFNPVTVYTEAWAHSCVSFNNEVYRVLSNTPSIEIVVLATTFKSFTGTWQSVVYGTGSDFRIETVNQEAALTAMSDTIAAIRKLGKRVVIVAPPPSANIDMSRCHERRALGMVVLGRSDCSISISEDRAWYAKEMAFLSELQRRANVTTVDFRPWICDQTKCQTEIAGRALYRDAIHLSNIGSEVLGRQIEFARLISNAAK